MYGAWRASMRQDSRSIGIEAEQSAADWLTGPGMRLVSRNYRCKSGEIDLIFEEALEDAGLELVFVEVRSRARGSWVSALESVSHTKRNRLSRAIRHYLARYRGAAQSMRVDILARDGGGWEHFKNIRLDGGY